MSILLRCQQAEHFLCLIILTRYPFTLLLIMESFPEFPKSVWKPLNLLDVGNQGVNIVCNDSFIPEGFKCPFNPKAQLCIYVQRTFSCRSVILNHVWAETTEPIIGMYSKEKVLVINGWNCRKNGSLQPPFIPKGRVKHYTQGHC